MKGKKRKSAAPRGKRPADKGGAVGFPHFAKKKKKKKGKKMGQPASFETGKRGKKQAPSSVSEKIETGGGGMDALPCVGKSQKGGGKKRSLRHEKIAKARGSENM